jgi:hypothetical protein
MFRSVLVALLAVLALGAVAATAAQATEGPFWRIPCHKVSTENKGKGAFGEEGCKSTSGLKEWDTRLLAGEKSEVTAKAVTSYVFHLGAGASMTCKKLTLTNEVAVGSSGANPGIREENVTFNECTIVGWGEGCHVEHETITSQPVEYRFGYEKFGNEIKERAGKVLILLRAKGGIFANIRFEGGGCYRKEVPLTGSVAAEAWSGGKAVEVGKEPTQNKINEVIFPKSHIKVIWMEKEGKVEEKKLTLGGFNGSEEWLEGRSEVELASKEPFGVFTK